MKIRELSQTYQAWAVKRYRHPDKTQTRTALNNRYAIKPLVALFGRRKLDTLKTRDVQAVQTNMVELGWARSTINDRMSRCRSFVRWAIEKELAAPESILVWEAISHLAYGLTEAAETSPVISANLDDVKRTAAALPDHLQRMIRLQIATGMRSTELCRMRWDYIDRASEHWVYRPTQHKTRHYGHARYIPIRQTDAPLLGPPRRSGYVFLNRNRRPYTRDTYRQQIVRAIKRTKSNHWTPLQLRHNAATDWFNKAGYDTASILLGHKDRRSTARYIDQQLHDVVAASKKVA